MNHILEDRSLVGLPHKSLPIWLISRRKVQSFSTANKHKPTKHHGFPREERKQNSRCCWDNHRMYVDKASLTGDSNANRPSFLNQLFSPSLCNYTSIQHPRYDCTRIKLFLKSYNAYDRCVILLYIHNETKQSFGTVGVVVITFPLHAKGLHWKAHIMDR